MLPKIFFAYFAFAILFISMLVVTRKNPVHSVLWMLLLFFHLAGLYLFLNAEFLAAVQIVVYAGAILVLFLFVVFLLNIKEEIKAKRFINAWPTSFTFALVLFLLFVMAFRSYLAPPAGPYTVKMIQSESNIAVLGKVLYTEFLFPFEIASLILLIAIVGAIVLAKRRLKS